MIVLAAPQIGILERLFVYSAENSKGVIINPKIVNRSGVTLNEEGCLSLPNVLVDVERSEFVEVEGVDLNGNPITVKESGIGAVVIQHEMDHLDGVLITDYGVSK